MLISVTAVSEDLSVLLFSIDLVELVINCASCYIVTQPEIRPTD